MSDPLLSAQMRNEILARIEKHEREAKTCWRNGMPTSASANDGAVRALSAILTYAADKPE